MSTQVKANKKVINFLQTCGNQNLMYLLEPARLQQALAVLDTDRDGQIDASEWCCLGVLASFLLRRRRDAVPVARHAGRTRSRTR